MSTLSNFNAKPFFTQELITTFETLGSPTAFLRSFFRIKESRNKAISIEVRRGTEKISTDVLRGTRGNRNSNDRYTSKKFIPPYFREYIDATDFDWYDVMFGEMETKISAANFNAFVDEAATDLVMLKQKIERAYELQAAQVMLDGIVQLQYGVDIDFKRKAASLVDLGAANYWDSASVNPTTAIELGCQFIRKEGLSMGSDFNAIMGVEAYRALLANEIFQKEGDIRRIDTMSINEPQRNSMGATSHGYFSAGDYTINVWTYDQYYEDSNGNKATYIDPKKVVLLPSNPTFDHSFAAVPMLQRNTSNAEVPQMMTSQQGQYIVGNYIDQVGEKHVFDVKSAALTIPVSIDEIYTFKALGG